MDAEHVNIGGGNTSNQQPQEPQPRKRFLPIRPNVALPFLASLFPCLRHRANTAPTVPPAPPPTPAPAPAPAVSPTPEPASKPVTSQTQPPSLEPEEKSVLMSLDDFSRFINAIETLLKPAPQLWHQFLTILQPFLSPPSQSGPQEVRA